MNVEWKDAEALSRTLNAALRHGYRYMEVPYQRMDNIQFFNEKSEALTNSYLKRSKEGDITDAVPILAMKEQLDKKIELEKIYQPLDEERKSIAMDINLIKFQERARGQIFAEDITRQLKIHHILPDIASLKKNIEEDRASFDINGVHRENGNDKHYIIRVEQNEHRAFMIQAIEKMPQVQQHVKSEGLQFSIIKNDLKDLRDRLEREGQNGNRFVAFPDIQVVGKEDFVAFKSAFSALQHAHENSTDRDHYIVRSIHVVQVEIEKMMEDKKEAVLNPESGSKRSKGMDMSR